MGRYLRYLMMFGPMIYRAYTKWSNGRSKKSVDQQSTAHTQQKPNQGEANPNYKDKDVKHNGDEFV